MQHSALGLRGAVTAPHRLAALAGRDVLEAGGTAIEAMVASAATIAVVYPHMNGIGGDAFWLIRRAGEAPIAISGAGRAAALATPERYAGRGFAEIPARGPDAALLVPGAVSSWQLALEADPANRMPFASLLAPAIRYAREGSATTGSQSRLAMSRRKELEGVPGFDEVFLPGGEPPAPGQRFVQPRLAETLEHLATHGPRSFYDGEIAAAHALFLTEIDAPLRAADFAGYAAERVTPLSTRLRVGEIFNLPPPTQGIAALMILALFDRLGVAEAEGFAHVHGLVEATKAAYRLRNRHLGDPDAMGEGPAEWLQPAFLDRLAAGIDRDRATPWPEPAVLGDTIWMGAADSSGTVVSFIQSLFWEFGSGVTCPETGVVFENRGAGFALRPGPNQLAPGKRPFHTLNPALALFDDGRAMAYGTMGGEGQPQTQAALFSRYGLLGTPLQQAISAPRWLLGKTWGDANTRLKLEARLAPDLVAALAAAGHDTESVGPYEDMMGHAGAVVLHPDGHFEAATDPRADGAALAF